MKLKLLFTLNFLFSILAFSQSTITDLSTFVSGLDNPNDIKAVNDILYVATAKQLLSYDISETASTSSTENTSPTTPTASIIFNTFDDTNTRAYGIVGFNIKDGFAFINVEVINPSEGVFVESRILRVNLADTTDILLIETLSDSYISAVTFSGNLLYRVTDTESSDTSTLWVRDTSVPNSSFTSVATFAGTVKNITAFQNLIIVSQNDNLLSYIDVNAMSPTLTPFSITNTAIGSTGLQVLGEQLFFTENNKIREGYIIDTNAFVDSYTLIENTTYKSIGNTNEDLSDIFIYKGNAYISIKESGLIIKANISSDNSCPSEGYTLNMFTDGLTNPEGLTIHNGDLYYSEFSNGIFKININTKTKETIYEASKTGNNYEFISQFIIENNIIYFTSDTADISTADFNITSSDIKKIDLNTNDLTPTTLITSLSEDFIYTFAKNGDTITYFTSKDNGDDQTNLFTLDLNDNSTSSTGITYDFNISSISTKDNNFYFAASNKIYNIDANNLPTTPSLYLDNTDGYIESLTVEGNDIFFSNGTSVKKVPIGSLEPQNNISTIAINSSITGDSGYDTTSCDDFFGLAINGNTIYSGMFLSGSIVSFANETLSISDEFTIKEHIANPFRFYNNTIDFLGNKEIKGGVYTINGTKVFNFDSSLTNTIDLNHLNSGIYIIKVGGNFFKVIKSNR